ncbi:HAD family hydrolase [Streptomyces carminius]|uniref:HAD family hydrolase n=1 Tax=Streptomyces carminius TaxID=2665496 RepID=A0A2M8LZL3_9ACTN|nr:HAD family hydrolase [Streptomyces carminius]PJE97398.1 HAD family hydrolase [Streptomyces carminius]
MTVEHVIFDWAGTLTPWHPVDLYEIWFETARVLTGVEDAAGVAEQLLRVERELMTRCRKNQCSGTLDEVFRAAGVEPSPEALAAYRRAWERHTFLDEHGVAVLRGLRERGLGVGVLSNTLWSARWHDEIFERDGVLDLIDVSVYSSETSWTKPHPEIFAAVMRQMGARSARTCVFVGDRLFEDIHGARAAGMLTIWVPHSSIPPEELGDSTAEPDAVVSTLTDVLAVVDSWNSGTDPAPGASDGDVRPV